VCPDGKDWFEPVGRFLSTVFFSPCVIKMFVAKDFKNYVRPSVSFKYKVVPNAMVGIKICIISSPLSMSSDALAAWFNKMLAQIMSKLMVRLMCN